MLIIAQLKPFFYPKEPKTIIWKLWFACFEYRDKIAQLSNKRLYAAVLCHSPSKSLNELINRFYLKKKVRVSSSLPTE